MLKRSAKFFFVKNLNRIVPIVGLVLFLKIALISNDSWSQRLQSTPEVSVDENRINISLPSGQMQTITVDREVKLVDVKLEDLTFSGREDLKVLKTRGAAQEFYDVYLYSPKQGKYVFNKKLSDVPCLQADAKRRQVIGACFHESSCENWEERYTVSARGALSLIERRGTYCDPMGKTYSYVDRFKNGKKISSKVTSLSYSTGQ
ncbi:MAG: hypothetical protein P4N59_16090 [Negativicutes bacterium]|nr:hypothetical protein [Burkholderia sp. R-69980]MDR3562937.1 hypothetical protein [Negativicutes bacterium]